MNEETRQKKTIRVDNLPTRRVKGCSSSDLMESEVVEVTGIIP